MLRKILQSFMFESEKEESNILGKEFEIALEKVNCLLTSWGTSMVDICNRAETAMDWITLKDAIKSFNSLMRHFRRIGPGNTNYLHIRRALHRLRITKKLSEKLDEATSFHDAINNYKMELSENLALEIQRLKVEDRRDEENDEKIFSLYMPKQKSNTPKRKRRIVVQAEAEEPKKKRKKLNQGRSILKNGEVGQQSSSMDFKRMKSQGICFWYSFGYCKRGSGCRFKHPQNV